MTVAHDESARAIARWIFRLQTLVILGGIGLLLHFMSESNMDFGALLDMGAAMFEGAVSGDNSYDGGGGAEMELPGMIATMQTLCSGLVVILQYFFWMTFGWAWGARN